VGHAQVAIGQRVTAGSCRRDALVALAIACVRPPRIVRGSMRVSGDATAVRHSRRFCIGERTQRSDDRA
jgi:hypothetical protein